MGVGILLIEGLAVFESQGLLGFSILSLTMTRLYLEPQIPCHFFGCLVYGNRISCIASRLVDTLFMG